MTGFYGAFQTDTAFQLGDFQSSLLISDVGLSTLQFLPSKPGSQALEFSDYYATVSYFDIFYNPLIPITVAYRIWDDTNKDRVLDWTPITSPGYSNTINLPAIAHQITNANHLTEMRRVTFRIGVSGGAVRYDSFAYSVDVVPGGPGAFGLVKTVPLITAIEPGPAYVAQLPAAAGVQATSSSDAYFSVNYLDINGSAYTPATAYWAVWDATNDVQVAPWTQIGSPSSVVTIDTPPSANTIGNSAHTSETRALVLFTTVTGGAQRYDYFDYQISAVPGGTPFTPTVPNTSTTKVARSMITMMPTSPPNQVPELSDYYAVCVPLDVNGNNYLPATVQWRLWDDTNKVQLINWTPITPALSMTVDIPAAAHSITNPDHSVEARQIIFSIVATGGAQRYENAAYNVIAVPDIP